MDQKDQIKRLKKIEGQVKGIQKMITEDRECEDVLTQIKSVQAALKKVAENVMKNHIQGCVTHAIDSNDLKKTKDTLDELISMISKYS